MYEKLILETLEDNRSLKDKIEKLENKMILLEKELINVKEKVEIIRDVNTKDNMNKYLLDKESNIIEPIDNDNNKKRSKITRNKIKKYVIEKLKEQENSSNYLIDIGNKELKADITIKDENSNNVLKLKCYGSKSYNDTYPVGWHTITQEDLNAYDFYVFVIVLNGDYFSFILNKEEVIDMAKKKTKYNYEDYHFSANYHFSIQLDQISEEYIDKRDNINIKFSEFYNKWDRPFKQLKAVAL